MCDSVAVLYIFVFIKIISIIILPILLLVITNKLVSKILLIIDIVLLSFILVCNTFTINKCVYRSNISGIENLKNELKINLYNEMHAPDTLYTSLGISAKKDYKTYSGKSLYYYNQNQDYMKDAYYECNNKKIYINSFGSSITTFSSAISTLFDNDINPIQIFDYYKEDYNDLCSEKITIEKIYDSFRKRYDSVSVMQIGVNEVENYIRSGDLVIAELSAVENSKLTCDTSYILIYNVDLENKYMISDPSLHKSDYVCPYSSNAYGNVIKSDNMDKSWTIDEINNEAIRYYLVKRV